MTTKQKRSVKRRKPVQARSRERLAEVIEHAQQLIIEDGFGELTMRKLAQRSGMALGNLQYYFPTKQALVHALVQHICSLHEGPVKARIASSGSPADAFATLIAYIIEDIRKPQGSILFWELWALAGHDKDAAAAVTTLYEFEQDLLADGIAQLNPELEPVEVRLRARVICAMLEGSSLMLGAGRPSAGDPEPLTNEIIEAAFLVARRPTSASTAPSRKT